MLSERCLNVSQIKTPKPSTKDTHSPDWLVGEGTDGAVVVVRCVDAPAIIERDLVRCRVFPSSKPAASTGMRTTGSDEGIFIRTRLVFWWDPQRQRPNAKPTGGGQTAGYTVSFRVGFARADLPRIKL